MKTLEQQIRDWWCNTGNSVDKDELISILLQILERIETLENKSEKPKAGETE